MAVQRPKNPLMKLRSSPAGSPLSSQCSKGSSKNARPPSAIAGKNDAVKRHGAAIKLTTGNIKDGWGKTVEGGAIPSRKPHWGETFLV